MRSWGMLAVAAAAITFGSTLAMPDVAVASEGGVMCGTYQENRKITRGEILARSRTWLTARVPYSQADCFGNRYGNYRTDCSGFVSMAWGLRNSYTTHILEQVSHRIDWADLRPGDALNDRLNHVALFIGWADAAKTRPIVREQAGPDGSKPVQRIWSAATAKAYTPLRYNNIVEGSAIPDMPPVTPDAPAAVAGPQLSNTAAGSLQVFARALDGTVQTNFHKTSRWNGWQELGDQRFAGDPVALLNPETKTVEVFARGIDGKLYRQAGDAPWQVLGDDVFAGDPVAVWNPDTKAVELFALGTDNRLLRRTAAGWAAIGDRQLAGTPSALYNPVSSKVEVFGRGADDRLIHFTGGDWTVLGEEKITSTPSAVHHVAGKSVEVFARGTDGAVVHVSSADWSAWKSLGGRIQDAPHAVYNTGTNAVDIVAWGEAGVVEQIRQTASGWTTWTKLGTQQVTKAPTATYHAQTKSLEVFARGADGKLIRRFYKEKAGWSQWATIGDRPLAQ